MCICAHVSQCMWEESVLSFYLLCPRDWAKVTSLGDKHCYQLSHLVNHGNPLLRRFFFFIFFSFFLLNLPKDKSERHYSWKGSLGGIKTETIGRSSQWQEEHREISGLLWSLSPCQSLSWLLSSHRPVPIPLCLPSCSSRTLSQSPQWLISIPSLFSVLRIFSTPVVTGAQPWWYCLRKQFSRTHLL